MPALLSYVPLFVVLLLALIASSTIKIAKEYERGVVFRLGRLIPLKGPGLFFIFPFGIDHLKKVDLRVVTLEVPQQEVITADNVTVKFPIPIELIRPLLAAPVPMNAPVASNGTPVPKTAEPATRVLPQPAPSL